MKPQPDLRFPTAFGVCGLSWGEHGLTGFRLPESGEPSPSPAAASAPEWIQEVIVRVQRHFEGDLDDFSDVALDWPRVSDFQKAVYLQTQAIRPGEKKSYGEIARLVGLGREGARSVGMALGANPWPLIVPCHRVVSSSGKMTGFSGPGGIRTKTRLLVLEGAELLSE